MVESQQRKELCIRHTHSINYRTDALIRVCSVTDCLKTVLTADVAVGRAAGRWDVPSLPRDDGLQTFFGNGGDRGMEWTPSEPSLPGVSR